MSKLGNEICFMAPASNWNEALPVGNGRLGAMVFGRAAKETIQLNEDSIWLGGYKNRNNPDALLNLPKVRDLLMNGDVSEAEMLLKRAFSGIPNSMQPYQTLGECIISFPSINSEVVTDYSRKLDLEKAIVSSSYSHDGTKVEQEVFSSAPDKCLFVHYKVVGEGKLNFDVLMTRGKEYEGIKRISNEAVLLYGRLGADGMRFGICVKVVVDDGKAGIVGENLVVEGASEALLIINGGSEYRYSNLEKELYEEIEQTLKYSFEDIKSRHIEDYQRMYNRVKLDLVDKEFSIYERYFNFGRYLMISGSRPGTLPLNLQGIWNDSFYPAWDSKYTININTQMNYWPAEVCNLSECHEPLFNLMCKMEEHGKETAREMYGCRGIVAHHNTNIWGDTAPQDLWIPGTYWVMGFAWLCTHIWTHYEYTLDLKFLKEHYHLIVESARFFLDFLIEDNEGYLVTCPSVSPENTYIIDPLHKGCNGYGVTMDNMILRDLFDICVKSAQLLNLENEETELVRITRERLRPITVGKRGQIMEWAKDYDEAEPGHRHISQLYGLFPSDQISIEKTPELAKAAARTIELRLQNGGGHTGWSRAWIINFYAKLHDGEKALFHLKELLEKSTLPNMFDNHPPFQIDGNFGGTAAIANMLLQSREGEIVLLPALPKEWTCGSIKGLKAIGNITVDISWKDGKLADYRISAIDDERPKVYYQGKILS